MRCISCEHRPVVSMLPLMRVQLLCMNAVCPPSIPIGQVCGRCTTPDPMSNGPTYCATGNAVGGPGVCLSVLTGDLAPAENISTALCESGKLAKIADRLLATHRHRPCACCSSRHMLTMPSTSSATRMLAFQGDDEPSAMYPDFGCCVARLPGGATVRRSML